MHKHIVITGASSGIGAALALEYASVGVRLSLCGRDQMRLSATAETCRAKGADVEAQILDVTDAEKMRAWLEACDGQRPVDMVIANAGISGGTDGMFSGESEAQVRRIFDVNVYGVLNSIHPLLPRMSARGQGQLVIISSLAGYRGWPGAPAYCGSKAAVRVYGEALRGSLAVTGVKVNVVCPGFIRSRMTDANQFPMPFLMDTPQAAAYIARKLMHNKGRISFPPIVVFFVWLFALLPDSFAQQLLSFSPAKSQNANV